jgi:hypothetical protein
MAGYGTTNFGGLAVPGYAFPKVISGTLPYTAFGTTSATVGTAPFPGTIPAGATFYRSSITNLTGFAGTPNATAVLQIGDDTTANRYMGTISVYGTALTNANGIAAGTPATTVYHTEAKQPIATLTMGSAFGSVNAGSFVANLYYFD